jgi:hypothetical protein
MRSDLSKNFESNTKTKLGGWKTPSLVKSMTRIARSFSLISSWKRDQKSEPRNKRTMPRKNKPTRRRSRNYNGNSKQQRANYDATKVKQWTLCSDNWICRPKKGNAGKRNWPTPKLNCCVLEKIARVRFRATNRGRMSWHNWRKIKGKPRHNSIISRRPKPERWKNTRRV